MQSRSSRIVVRGDGDVSYSAAVHATHLGIGTSPTTGAMDRTALGHELEALHVESFAWALACCGRDTADAEDVLQSAYVRVLEGRARFAGRSTFRTWLFGVIRHVAAEERRRRWLVARLRNGNGRVQTAPVQATDARIESEQRAAQLRAALETLPRRQREVLELVFYHELTIEEAGQVMGVRVGTARTHYERGKRNLRQRLDREDR